MPTIPRGRGEASPMERAVVPGGWSKQTPLLLVSPSVLPTPGPLMSVFATSTEASRRMKVGALGPKRGVQGT